MGDGTGVRSEILVDGVGLQDGNVDVGPNRVEDHGDVEAQDQVLVRTQRLRSGLHVEDKAFPVTAKYANQ